MELVLFSFILVVVLFFLVVLLSRGYTQFALQSGNNQANFTEQNQLQEQMTQQGQGISDLIKDRKPDLTSARAYRIGSDDCDGDTDSMDSSYKDACGSNEEDNTLDDSDRKDDDGIGNGDDKNLYNTDKVFEAFIDKSTLCTLMGKNGALVGLMDYIPEMFRQMENMEFNIAVTGNSGTGKSSLINTFLGLRAKDKGAAEVGITETTTEAKKYHSPDNENFILWDLPGMGTFALKRDEYLSKFDFAKYEIIIVVSATRFTENDIWLAREILKMNKYVFFVRTKIDIDLANEEHDHPDNFNVASSLHKVREEITIHLKTAGIYRSEAKFYIVTSRDRNKYDFPIMFDMLRELVNMKSFRVSRLLQKHALSASEQKSKCMREELTGIYRYNAITLSSGMKVFIDKFLEDCRNIFCQEDEIIKRVARETNTTVKDLKESRIVFLKTNTLVNVSLDLLRSKFWVLSDYWIFKDAVDEIIVNLSKEECSLIVLRIQELERQLQTLKYF